MALPGLKNGLVKYNMIDHSSSRQPDLAIHSKNTILPNGTSDVFLLIKDGTIYGIERSFGNGLTCPIKEQGDLVLMPGIVDSHVHINEPGRTEWEGFETATKAALAGGITTLVDMPLNSTPVTTTPTNFENKRDASNGKLHTNCGFWGGVVPENADQMSPLIECGVLGIKAFLIHSGIEDFPNVTKGDLEKAMPVIAGAGLPLLVHSELEPMDWEPGEINDYHSFLHSRPRSWEDEAITLMIDLCREYHCRTHIVHLSSSNSLDALARAKEEGLPITVETCPHYLYFSADKIPSSNTLFKCTPPIREKENNELLWNGIKNGIIDLVVTDHSPAPLSMKQGSGLDFSNAWGGISSLQFSLPAFWTKARNYGFNIQDVCRLMCEKPAELIGQAKIKGTIAIGADADLTIWDPNSPVTPASRDIHYKHPFTPFEGQPLMGKVRETYIGGICAFQDGDFVSLRQGKLVLNL